MTRRMVYGFGLWLTLACTAMTIASIIEPRWLSYSPNGERKASMGLHRYCRSSTNKCDHFPEQKLGDCDGDKWSFCSMWRTVGFFISFSVVIELLTVVSFIVIISGGVQRRSTGWKVITPILAFGGIVQCAGMAIVAFLYDHDERFIEGWHLDLSWTLVTISWTVLVLTSAGIVASALYLPTEGGYELIPNAQQFEVEEDEQLNSRIGAWNDGYQRD
ncbi:hypothetical protein BDV96DRAFT_573522 [Lophiotrema nucula]|uniref:Uncharacterized protein n=1 Tax=Lophiotrema nucula TaxID=690887 RepID=A0A6A5ZBT4_9PLEO|nr:hypothetical protein BDV96DRAFT_573522 [Lophiotrema nucula]